MADLSKAFDRNDHRILLDKLYAYGIRGNCHKLLTSYLQNRKQIVELRDENGRIVRSQPKGNGTGVPRGSILGPLLFIMYLNDLKNTIKQAYLYADDTTIVIQGDTKEEAETKIISTINGSLKIC